MKKLNKSKGPNFPNPKQAVKIYVEKCIKKESCEAKVAVTSGSDHGQVAKI